MSYFFCHIAHTADGLDIVFILSQLQFFTKGIDIYIDNSSIILKMDIPNTFNDTGPSADYTLVANKIFQKCKLFLRKTNFFLVFMDLMGCGVKNDVSKFKYGMFPRFRAQLHLDPFQKLFKV